MHQDTYPFAAGEPEPKKQNEETPKNCQRQLGRPRLFVSLPRICQCPRLQRPRLRGPEQDSLEGLADNPWRWAKAPRQWRRTCLETVQVPYVTRKNWTQRIYRHTYCRWCKHSTCREYDEKMGRCKRDYVKRIHTTHSQHYREECRRWQWDRECAAGTGLYIKQIDPGQCMREPDHSDGGLALTETAPRAFECPDGYSSGNGGTRKFQPGCTCRPQCGERKWTK